MNEVFLEGSRSGVVSPIREPPKRTNRRRQLLRNAFYVASSAPPSTRQLVSLVLSAESAECPRISGRGVRSTLPSKCGSCGAPRIALVSLWSTPSREKKKERPYSANVASARMRSHVYVCAVNTVLRVRVHARRVGAAEGALVSHALLCAKEVFCEALLCVRMRAYAGVQCVRKEGKWEGQNSIWCDLV